MNILKRLFAKKPKETSLDIHKKIRVTFSRIDDTRLGVRVFKMVNNQETISESFYIREGDSIHITWILDIPNEEIRKAFKLLVG